MLRTGRQAGPVLGIQTDAHLASCEKQALPYPGAGGGPYIRTTTSPPLGGVCLSCTCAVGQAHQVPLAAALQASSWCSLEASLAQWPGAELVEGCPWAAYARLGLVAGEAGTPAMTLLQDTRPGPETGPVLASALGCWMPRSSVALAGVLRPSLWCPPARGVVSIQEGARSLCKAVLPGGSWIGVRLTSVCADSPYLWNLQSYLRSCCSRVVLLGLSDIPGAWHS